MGDVLFDVDSWITATALAAAMVGSWAVGLWTGRRSSRTGQPAGDGKPTDACLALLGLLLAFTFSMSALKHDQRRQMVVTDSNSIGDFGTCVAILKEPIRAKLQRLLHEYVEHRLALAAQKPTEAMLNQALADYQAMHNHMQALVGEAVDAGTPIAVPLVNTFNELTSSHASRLAAGRDRLPPSIVALMFLAAVISTALVGRQQGFAAESRPVATLAFIALVCMVVWVILDLNQPARGMITVSQEPLQRLLAGMPAAGP